MKTPDTETSPLVSAIISTYNSERFIQGCIEDLERQSIAHQLEIIVIDSASHQNEHVLVRKLQGKYDNIRYLRTDQHETVYAAWNRGIAVARGRYITNANTDDRHRSDAFELMVHVMESRPEVDLVYADVLITKTPNETFEHHTPTGSYNWYDWDRNLLLNKGCFVGPQPMWRRSLHELYGGFDSSYVTSGDYEFWLRISQTSDFFHIRQTLGLYLAHPGSIEHQNEDIKGIENRKILNIYRQAAKEGCLVGLVPFQKIRAFATEKYCAMTHAALGSLVGFIEGRLMPGAVVSCNHRGNYLMAKTRLLEHTDQSSQLIEDFLSGASLMILRNKEWYVSRCSVEDTGADESLLRLEVLSTALQKARLHFQRGEVDEAVSMLLNQGIKFSASSPVAYFELAETLMAVGRYENALQVLPEMPPSADVFRLQEIAAICFASLGQDEPARLAAIQAIGLPRALVVLGTLAVRNGNLSGAENYFCRAVETDPSCGSALLSLGMLLWEQGKFMEAWDMVKRSMAVEPLKGETVRIMMDMAARLDCTPTALTLIGNSVRIYPESRNLSLVYAEMLAECGDDTGALEACESFLVRFGVDEKLLTLALELRERVGVYNKLAESGAHSVSLCMIVKNEEKCLANCLTSLKPVVDEMIVIDTGSEDRTVDIATTFGARVYDFTWNGDFSATRNYSLSEALGRWILVMDADEVLSERDYPLLQQLLHRSTVKQVAWSVVTRNYTNRTEKEGWHANDGSYPEQETGDGWYPSKKVRLFPALQSIRFHGEIHEMVETDLRTVGIPVEQANFVVHHFGEFVDDDCRVKQLRYYNMGKQKLLERPDDIIAYVELALQAGELELFDEALELWDNLLSRGITSLDVYFNRSFVLMGLNRFSEASDMAIKALNINPDHKESAYNYGMCMLNLGRPEQAVAFVAQESAECPDYPLLMALLCVLYLCTGDSVSAKGLSEKLTESNYAISAYINARVVSLEQLGHFVLAQQLRQTAVNEPNE